MGNRITQNDRGEQPAGAGAAGLAGLACRAVSAYSEGSWEGIAQ